MKKTNLYASNGLTFFLTFSLQVFFAPANSEEICAQCHAEQVKQWRNSHHYNAMAPATKKSVLGDFNNQTLHNGDTTIRFFLESGQPKIEMPNNTGKLQQYSVAHAFGYVPLQQYTFEVSPGKFQFFPYAWDSRSQEEGGQRWFNLYPNMQPHDEFHWSQMGQNWNQMCVECHVTDYKKSFDAGSGDYHPQFSAGNVSCGACHGNSDAHLQWADGAKDIANKGYPINIRAQTPLFLPNDQGNLQAVTEIVASQQINSCASCHSRRAAFKDREKPHEFYDQYQPALLTDDLYHLDGQIWDEDYVWGSFLQSKKYQAGVTCSNCHNPHTAQTKIAGNGLCTQCHGSEPYDKPQHLGHAPGTPGSACVDCHMAATVYMAVDARRDHGFHIPRPDLTQRTGVPNACNRCHDDKTPQWASGTIAKWHPQAKYQGQAHFADTFFAAQRREPGVDEALTQLTQDNTQPAIVRASALQRLTDTPGRNALVAIMRATQSEEPLLQQAAIRAAAPYEAPDRWRLLHALLSSERLPIRTEAARSLAPLLLTQNLAAEHQKLLQQVLQEYREVQGYQADRGFAHANLGNLALELGQPLEAEKHYLAAISIEPIFMGAYVNLAELYRQQGSEQKAREVLQQALAVNASASPINSAMAMSLIREGKKPQALVFLKKAATQGEPNVDTLYAYALLLQDQNQTRAAREQLLKIYQLTPGNPDISYSLSQNYLTENDYDNALRFAKNLAELVPGNSQIQQMVVHIEQLQRASP